MFGKHFEFKKAETGVETLPIKREEVFEDFDKEEAVIQKEAEGFLMGLVPEKFKREAVGLLAALSIFTASSSAFAEGFKGEEIDKGGLLPGDQMAQVAQEDLSSQELFKKMTGDTKDEFVPFDWKKISDKIEISVGGNFEKIPGYRAEEVSDISDYRHIVSYDFYKDLSGKGVDETISVLSRSISQSNNAVEFFKNLEVQEENLDDRQKVLFLQNLAKWLNKNYDQDMFESGERVEISDDKMFQALKDLYENKIEGEAGVCGNISTFVVKSAEKLGLEAWIQNGSNRGVADIWSGATIEVGGQKQIVFIPYWGDLISTGTLNYRDALGIAERYMGAIGTFNSFVGNEKEVLFPVKSRAQEVIEKAAGIEETGARLEEELAIGKLKKEKGLEIKLSPETKEIKLSKDTFALAYFNFQDFSNNPYQSMEDLNALRGRLNLKGERFGLEADATVLHMNIKDLEEGSVTQDEIIGRLAADYIDSHKFTKSEYGQFVLNFGATLQSALRLPLDKKIEMTAAGVMGEAGAGMRLIYINPAETGKFYVGAQEMFRGQTNDFQNQDLIIKKVAKTLTVGAEIKVNEAQILNLEAAGSELDWGKKIGIKGGLSGKEWKGELGYEKATSEYERFVPSSDKVSAEVGYKGGPKWEIDVLGSKSTEKYADAKGKDTYGAEVKLKVFLW